MATVAEEIDKHPPSLFNLRAQDNSSLPIFRLPPETLSNIFIHGARDYHESTDRHTFRVPDWVNVSYVGSHWRNVALNCATLWTYHFNVSIRWTEELLARSKEASLKIRIHFDHWSRAMSWWSDLLVKLLSYADRIQELSLRIPDMVLPPNLSLCAPRLQILDIDKYFGNPSDWHATMDDGDIPPLRIVKLTGSSLLWHSFNLSGVTTLFLSAVPAPFRRNTVEFLATLRCMQGLTVLHLEYALSSSLSDGAFRVSPKIGLPCLSRLFVIAPLSTVVALLSCTDIPLKT